MLERKKLFRNFRFYFFFILFHSEVFYIDKKGNDYKKLLKSQKHVEFLVFEFRDFLTAEYRKICCCFKFMNFPIKPDYFFLIFGTSFDFMIHTCFRIIKKSLVLFHFIHFVGLISNVRSRAGERILNNLSNLS